MIYGRHNYLEITIVNGSGNQLLTGEHCVMVTGCFVHNDAMDTAGQLTQKPPAVPFGMRNLPLWQLPTNRLAILGTC